MLNIMKSKYLHLLLCPFLCYPSAYAVVGVDFNTPGQLTGQFFSSSPNAITESATGGLDNTGSLVLTSLSGTTEFLTFKTSFSGDTANWKASLYLFGNPNDQDLWQFGVVSDIVAGQAFGFATNDAGATYLPYISTGTNDSDGGRLTTFQLGSPGGMTESGTQVETTPDYQTVDSWYHYEIETNYLGSNQYSFKSTISAASSDGTVGATYATVTDTYTNASLASDSEVYLYLAAFTGERIDGFSTTAVVPEPSSVTLLLAAALPFLYRRRR